MTDSIILSAIGSAILLLLSLAGFFIKRWMDKTEIAEDRAMTLIGKMNVTLQALNTTMLEINHNLLLYQAKVDATIDNIKCNINDHKNIYIREKKVVDKILSEHDNDIQDHTIRISILEKTK